MKKKKLTSLLAVSLAAAMLLSGCGDGGNTDGSSQQPSSSNPATNNGGGEANNGGGETNNGGDNGVVDTPAAPELTFADGTVLRMACGYNNAKTGITFDPETAGEGITLADGITYNAGDLKPTWVECDNVLVMKVED
ncbi:MAG: hypothetical protein K2J60_03085, partial [Acetatifactor sp.]|nr:hypothetical protein [Acetatifactor sp.]